MKYKIRDVYLNVNGNNIKVVVVLGQEKLTVHPVQFGIYNLFGI